MKKNFITNDFKKHMKRRAIYQYKKILRKYKNQKLIKNLLDYVSSKSYKIHKIKMKENILFPDSISFINKTIGDIKKCKDKNIKISLNHKNIKEFDNVSILILTALLGSFDNKKKYIKSAKLKPSKEIDKRLSAVGYWDALCINSRYSEEIEYLKIKSHDKKEIDNRFHYEIINFFNKFIDYSDDFQEYLFNSIYEAMANSKEHAYDNENKKIWLLGNYCKEKQQLEFIFYDIGIGVFKSLPNSKLKRWFEKIQFNSTKKDILKELCTTDLSHYKDNKRRGTGMQTYKEFFEFARKNDFYVNVEVFTDNVYYSCLDNKSNCIKGSIKGTLIRWVIKKTGANHDRKTNI